MQVIHLYLVSIFLSCVKLSIVIAVAGVQCIPGLSISSSINNVYSSQPKTLGGSMYNSGIGKTLKCNDSNTRITAVNKFENKVADNNYLAGSFYDNPGDSDTLSYKLYDATTSVLNSIFKDCL